MKPSPIQLRDPIPRFTGEMIGYQPRREPDEGSVVAFPSPLPLGVPPLSLWRHDTLPQAVERARMIDIATRVAQRFGTDLETLRGPSTKDLACRARSVAARRMLAAGFSSTRVGRFLGNRDHTTILAIAKGRARRRRHRGLRASA